MELNGELTVMRNIYLSYCSLAIRFVSYVKEAFPNTIERNRGFLVHSILDLIEFVIAVIKNQTRSRVAKENGCQLYFNKKQIET